MDRPSDFHLGTSDPEVTARLRDLPEDSRVLDRRYTQEEDFFLVLEAPFTVESFEIHHTVSDPNPSDRYRRMIRLAVDAWTGQLPSVFRGLSWYFDPKDLFHPLFVQVLSARDRKYLYLLRPDLTFRGRHHQVLERGGNDVTARYASRRLFVESEVLPLDTWESTPTEKRLWLAKLFELTWQGETGRGYFLEGRWIDHEITKLLSKAALPAGTRTYPHYPLRCRHNTLAVKCANPTPEGRRRAAAVLEAAWPLVAPWSRRIQDDLKDQAFAEDHPLLAELRPEWSVKLAPRWGQWSLEPYLDNTQKEYRYRGD